MCVRYLVQTRRQNARNQPAGNVVHVCLVRRIEFGKSNCRGRLGNHILNIHKRTHLRTWAQNAGGAFEDNEWIVCNTCIGSVFQNGVLDSLIAYHLYSWNECL